MEFYEYRTMWTEMKKDLPRDASMGHYYGMTLRNVLREHGPDSRFALRVTQLMSAEMAWVDDRQPFYRVRPSVIDMLCRMPLESVPMASIKPPIPTLALYMPKTDDPAKQISVDGVHVMSVLVTWCYGVLCAPQAQLFAKWSGEKIDDKKVDSSAFFRVDLLAPDGEKIDLYWTVPLNDERTVAEHLDGVRSTTGEGGPNPGEIYDEDFIMRKVTAMYCALAMIDQDSDMIDQLVLKKDREKYKKSQDPKFIEKAKKRGLVGWDVGRTIEKSPHFRRKHWAIRWTGPGRKVPKLRPIKESWVHRDKITTVPTEDDE